MRDPILIAYRTTPLFNNTKSPAELLMGRRLRTTLNSHLDTRSAANERNYYDPKYGNQHTKTLEDLQPGDIVRMQSQTNKYKKWPTKAKVVKKLANSPRSYIVITSDGKEFQRNRVHLKKTNEPWTSYEPSPQYDIDLDTIDHNVDNDPLYPQEEEDDVYVNQFRIPNDQTDDISREDYRRFSNRRRDKPRFYGIEN